MECYAVVNKKVAKHNIATWGAVAIWPVGEPTGWVVAVVAVVAALWAGHRWLTTTVTPRLDPFRTFPWWLLPTVGATSWYTGGHPGVAVPVAYGSAYLGGHVTHRVQAWWANRQVEIDSNFTLVGWPAQAAVVVWTWIVVVGYFFDWSCQYWGHPVVIFQAIFTTYGVYYCWVWWVRWTNKLIPVNPPGLLNYQQLEPASYLTAGLVKIRLIFPTTATVATAAAGGAAATASLASYLNSREQRTHDMTEKMMNFARENNRYYLDKRESYIKQRIPFEYKPDGSPYSTGPSVGNWPWSPPYNPPSPPPSSGGSMFSPIEIFVTTGWVAPVVVAIAVGCVVWWWRTKSKPRSPWVIAPVWVWTGWLPHQEKTNGEVYGTPPPLVESFWDLPALVVLLFLIGLLFWATLLLKKRVSSLWAIIPVGKTEFFNPAPTVTTTVGTQTIEEVVPDLLETLVDTASETMSSTEVAQFFSLPPTLPEVNLTPLLSFTLYAGVTTLAASAVVGGLCLWVCPWTPPPCFSGSSLLQRFRARLRQIISFLYYRVGGFTLAAGVTFTVGVGISYGLGVYLGHYHGPLDLSIRRAEFLSAFFLLYARFMRWYYRYQLVEEGVQAVVDQFSDPEVLLFLTRMGGELSDHQLDRAAAVLVIFQVRRVWVRLFYAAVAAVAVWLVVDHFFFREVFLPHFSEATQLAYNNMVHSKQVLDQLTSGLERLRLEKPCAVFVDQYGAEHTYQVLIKSANLIHRNNVVLYNQLALANNQFLEFPFQVPLVSQPRLSYLERAFAQALRLYQWGRSSIG